MKTKDLRTLSESELVARKNELKDELFRLRIQKTAGQVEKPHFFRLNRKEIAQIETILTEREALEASKTLATK
jgi:large subunit ribosomal protein L29